MRITDVRLDEVGGLVGAVGRVEWDDGDRPPAELYFATDPIHGDDLVAAGDAFLAPGAILAMEHGERRLVLDAETCPFLVDGVQVALDVLRDWYGGEPPRLETEVRSRPLATGPRRSALAFSGGVDSTYTLWRNRRTIPSSHPGRIADGFLVQSLGRAPYNARAMEAVHRIAEAAGLTLISVFTNLRELDPRSEFWERKLLGAGVAAIGHLFPARIQDLVLASTYRVDMIHPYGSHPMIDPLYSSYEVRIRHGAFDVSRLQKTRALLEWDVVAANLNVCVKREPLADDVLNCGECPKCLRTRLTYLALGIDDRPAFSGPALSAELVEGRMRFDDAGWLFLGELLEPLRGAGHGDLADALLRVRRRNRFRELDGRYFGGVVAGGRRLVRKIRTRRP